MISFRRISRDSFEIFCVLVFSFTIALFVGPRLGDALFGLNQSSAEVRIFSTPESTDCEMIMESSHDD